MNTLILMTACLIPGAQMEPLQAGAAVVDKGDIKAGRPLSQSFTLCNRGEAPLVLVGLNAGCGCAHPRIGQKNLALGESTELSVDINTLAQNSGPNTWKITVRYQYGPVEQPVTRELELQIKANLVREVHVDPVSIFLAIEREASHTITVTDRRAKPLTITSARCDSKHVKLVLTATGVNSKGERVQQVHLTVLESCPPGHFSEPVILRTDDPDYPELRVPLMVARRVAGQATATPEQLDLRLTRGQRAASGLVRLRTPDDQSVVIDRVEADAPAVRFKWAAGPGPMATLRLGVELEGMPTSGLSSVKVHLKEPKGQVIVIPVSWQTP